MDTNLPEPGHSAPRKPTSDPRLSAEFAQQRAYTRLCSRRIGSAFGGFLSNLQRF